MPNVTIYNFKTQQKAVIPQEELAPGWVKLAVPNNAAKGEEILWVDPAELKPGHLSLDEGRLRLLREIQQTLWEVYPLSFEGWEATIRLSPHPNSATAAWRWVAYHLGRVTNSGRFRKARKQDLFEFLLALNRGRVVEVPGLSEQEAGVLLDMCQHTPLEFFGGETQAITKRLGWNPHDNYAFSFRCVGSLDEFRDLTATADVIVALDYVSGDLEVLFGRERLVMVSITQPVEQPQPRVTDTMFGRGKLPSIMPKLRWALFGLYFDAEFKRDPNATEFDAICAAVLSAKGNYWVNGKQRFAQPPAARAS